MRNISRLHYNGCQMANGIFKFIVWKRDLIDIPLKVVPMPAIDIKSDNMLFELNKAEQD